MSIFMCSLLEPMAAGEILVHHMDCIYRYIHIMVLQYFAAEVNYQMLKYRKLNFMKLAMKNFKNTRLKIQYAAL